MFLGMQRSLLESVEHFFIISYFCVEGSTKNLRGIQIESFDVDKKQFSYEGDKSVVTSQHGISPVHDDSLSRGKSGDAGNKGNDDKSTGRINYPKCPNCGKHGKHALTPEKCCGGQKKDKE